MHIQRMMPSTQCKVSSAIAVPQMRTHIAGDSQGEGWHLQDWGVCVHSAAACRRSASLACEPVLANYQLLVCCMPPLRTGSACCAMPVLAPHGSQPPRGSAEQ